MKIKQKMRNQNIEKKRNEILIIGLIEIKKYTLSISSR